MREAVLTFMLAAAGLLYAGEGLADGVRELRAEWLLAKDNENVIARFSAATVLYGEEFTEDEAAVLRAWLQVEESSWVRRALLQTLLAAKAEPAFIFGFLDSDDPNLRFLALHRLADEKQLDADIERRLLDLIRDESFWWVRAEAVRTLAGSATDEALEALHDASRDPIREVRGAAVEALGKRVDPRSFVPLLEVLQEASLPGSDNPMAAFASAGGRLAIPILEDAAQSASPLVRQAAACALDRMAEETRFPHTVTALEDQVTLVEAEGEFREATFQELNNVIRIRLSCGGPTWPGPHARWEPGARIVASSRGRGAGAWDYDDVLASRDTSTTMVPDGALASIDGIVHDGRITWAGVQTETDGFVWIREVDLRRLTPAEMN